MGFGFVLQNAASLEEVDLHLVSTRRLTDEDHVHVNVVAFNNSLLVNEYLGMLLDIC